MIFLEEELPQRSQKWHDFRQNGIGASEIPAIFGKAPPQWDNPYTIFLKKMGKTSQKSNKYLSRGQFLEEFGRNAVENYLKNCKNGVEMSVFCRNCIDVSEISLQHAPKFQQMTAKYKNFDKIFASFDGVDVNNKIILELKCTEEGSFRKMIKNPKINKMYMLQVQTQLMIANSHWGIKSAIFANYYPEGVYLEDKITGRTNLIRLVITQVDLDEEYCKIIEDTCRKFWKMVENKKWETNWNT